MYNRFHGRLSECLAYINAPAVRLCRQRREGVVEGGHGRVASQAVGEDLALTDAIVRHTEEYVVVDGILAYRPDVSHGGEVVGFEAL